MQTEVQQLCPLVLGLWLILVTQNIYPDPGPIKYLCIVLLDAIECSRIGGIKTHDSESQGQEEAGCMR